MVRAKLVSLDYVTLLNGKLLVANRKPRTDLGDPSASYLRLHQQVWYALVHRQKRRRYLRPPGPV